MNVFLCATQCRYLPLVPRNTHAIGRTRSFGIHARRALRSALAPPHHPHTRSDTDRCTRHRYTLCTRRGLHISRCSFAHPTPPASSANSTLISRNHDNTVHIDAVPLPPPVPARDDTKKDSAARGRQPPSPELRPVPSGPALYRCSSLAQLPPAA